jgi:hypothetical protein
MSIGSNITAGLLDYTTVFIPKSAFVNLSEEAFTGLRGLKSQFVHLLVVKSKLKETRRLLSWGCAVD